jgi:hypothetical protein
MKERKIKKQKKKLTHLFQMVLINGVLLTLFFSCGSKDKIEEEKIITYFGNRFVLSDNIDTVSAYLSSNGLSFEYNDSFSGEEEGVSEYHFQGQKDSIIYWSNLYFDEKKLVGVSVDFTSKSLINEVVFLNKVRNEITNSKVFNHSPKTEVIIDTSVINVSSLESSSGKAFRLKVYYKDLHNKIPYLF